MMPRSPFSLTLLASSVGLLAACSTPVLRDKPHAPPPPLTVSNVPVTNSAASPAPAKPSRSGGGYYKDDGPGDNPPPDMAAIPEPVPKKEPLRRAANKPYSVLGQDFQPYQSLVNYSAQGVGSWYGRKFHGQMTSSGETYDMYGMTAAHPILPIPSYARVTNLENGRSIVVRINDRGPFIGGRLIDLTYTAAWKLGYVDRGSAQVRVDAIIPGETPVYAATESKPPVWTQTDNDPIAVFAKEEREKPAAGTLAAIKTKGGVFLQLGAFSSKENAESFREHLSSNWPEAPLRVLAASGLYRVQSGPYNNPQAASDAAQRLSSQLGIKPFVVK